MFRELFEFEPPKSVREIKYKDVYNRYLMDGAWGRWIAFTYTPDVFLRIQTQGFRTNEGVYYTALESKAAPKWWPNVDQRTVTLYSKGHDDTPETEGFSFREYMWHDTNSNLVFFHKYYWD